jgi:hypothetical protein
MSEIFLETLLSELESSCNHKESKYHILWERKDVNLDITKCRNYCYIDNGYMWNGTQMCESCDKILHSKLDRFNKSSAEIAFEVISIEEKINNLTNIISKLENQVTNLDTRITEIVDKNDEQIIYFENQNKNIKDNIIKFDIKYQNLINSDRENIYELQKKINDCVNNIKNIESIINNQQNIINNQKSFHRDNLNNLNNQDNIGMNDDIDNNIHNNNNNNNNKNKNKNKNKNMNINKIATIKIFDKYKIGGIGYILNVNTITPGKIKRNYVYQSKNEEVVFRIKDFENNFNPQEFEYPDSGILIKPEFIKGNIMSIELYDEFISITS